MKAVKEALSHMHDRDALMALAFKGIGGLPLKRLQEQRAVEAVAVEAMMKSRGHDKRKAELKKTIAEAQAMQEARFEKSKDKQPMYVCWLRFGASPEQLSWKEVALGAELAMQRAGGA